MAGISPVTIVDVGYRSTHFWVVSAGKSRLLFDLGWPGSMGLMRSNLERMGIPLGEIRYGLASHYHIDHAGLAEELKRLGIPLLVLETQRAAIPGMKQFTKPHDHFTDIGLDDNVDLTFAESRALLASIGLAGQILPTPGHSDDSVSLVLDDGSAFTGDLTLEAMAYGPEAETVAASWRRLREAGATTIYPGHGPIYPLAPASVG